MNEHARQARNDAFRARWLAGWNKHSLLGHLNALDLVLHEHCKRSNHDGRPVLAAALKAARDACLAALPTSRK